ncbi:MAG: hypothetical protein Q7J42_01930 [Sulfuritalea sp.]|nr:hypothetical protein [Sulfuritalea sp.]
MATGAATIVGAGGTARGAGFGGKCSGGGCGGARKVACSNEGVSFVSTRKLAGQNISR